MDLLSTIYRIGEGLDGLFEVPACEQTHAHLVQRCRNAVLKDAQLWVAVSTGHAGLVPELRCNVKDPELHVNHCDVVHDRSRQLILDSFVGECVGTVLALGNDRHEAGHGPVVISEL